MKSIFLETDHIHEVREVLKDFVIELKLFFLGICFQFVWWRFTSARIKRDLLRDASQSQAGRHADLSNKTAIWNARRAGLTRRIKELTKQANLRPVAL